MHTGESGVPGFFRGGGTGRVGLFPCGGPCWLHLCLLPSIAVSFSFSSDSLSFLCCSSSGATLSCSTISPWAPVLLSAFSSPPCPPPSRSILAAGFCPFSLPFPSPASRLQLFLLEEDDNEEGARQRGAGGSAGADRPCSGTGGLEGGGGETGVDFLSSHSTAPTRTSSFFLAAGATVDMVSGGGGEEKSRPIPDPEPRLGGRGGGRLYFVSWLEELLVGPLTSGLAVCWGSPFCRLGVLLLPLVQVMFVVLVRLLVLSVQLVMQVLVLLLVMLVLMLLVLVVLVPGLTVNCSMSSLELSAKVMGSTYR